MKKEILFIMNNLNCGGAEKSLVSLLQALDYSQYNVDLFLFKNEGMFLKQVPQEVTILSPPKNYPFFDMSIKKAIIQNLNKGNFKVIFYRVLAGFVYRIEKEPAVREQKVWKYLKKVVKPIEKKYDVAIGYLEKTPNYFCVDKVIAKFKIGYIHTDYLEYKMNSKIDYPYFQKLNTIITVSETSKKILGNSFPLLKHKFDVIKSITSSKNIISLAKEPVSFEKKGIALLSIGRLSSEKGYDLAINACKILVGRGIELSWYVIGEGKERNNLLHLISENKLEDKFFLLGNKQNPYPYIKASDIFVHTARFEGYGIVVNEAKVLNKPILATNFNSVSDQIINNYNGLIAEMDSESIAKNLERLILDPTLRNKFSENLAKENFGTEKEIKKFYNLIEN
tara:strand:+ start:2095 stop:3279 length:1185 start_codon:yes stop_codon:yes gene_type:complete